MRSKIPTKAKLVKIVEAINVRAWEKVVGQPMTKEFYPLCERQFPEESERFERQRVKIYLHLLGGNKALAETFVLATDGFCADTPSVKDASRKNRHHGRSVLPQQVTSRRTRRRDL